MKTLDGVWSAVNTITTLLSVIVFYKLLATILGAEKIGLWALTSAALFGLRFADLSVNMALLRLVGSSAPSAVRDRLWSMMLVAFGINALAFFFLVGLSLLIAPHVIDSTIPGDRRVFAYQLIPWLILNSFVALLFGTFASAMVGSGRARALYKAGSAASFLQIIVGIPLIYYGGLKGYALAQTFYNLFQMLISAVLLRRGNPLRFPRMEDFDGVKQLLKVAGGLNVNGLISTMLDPLTKMLLGLFGSLDLVGTYELVWRAYGQVRLVAIAPLQPMAVSMMRTHDSDRLAFKKVYGQSLAYATFAGAVMIASIIPGTFLIKIMLHGASPEIFIVVLAVAFNYVPNVLAVPAYNAAIALGRIGLILTSTVIWVFLAATGWYYGRLFGVNGVLLAIGFSSLIANLFLIITVQREAQLTLFDAVSALNTILQVIGGPTARPSFRVRRGR